MGALKGTWAWLASSGVGERLCGLLMCLGLWLSSDEMHTAIPLTQDHAEQTFFAFPATVQPDGQARPSTAGSSCVFHSSLLDAVAGNRVEARTMSKYPNVSQR